MFPCDTNVYLVNDLCKVRSLSMCNELPIRCSPLKIFSFQHLSDPKGGCKMGCVKNLHHKVIFTILQRIKMVPKII
jgi:hypothetical protein